MSITRRDMMLLTGGALMATAVPLAAQETAVDLDAVIAEFTGGADIGEGDLTLTTPEIAENGNTVPVEVNAPGASEIFILATGNPTPKVATFTFGALAAQQFASTRIRLAGTQDVVAIAKLQDGSFIRASREVKVTIGGCGG